METLSLARLTPARGRLSWRAMAGALRGDALAAFPDAAFEEPVVVQTFLGRRHVLLQHPEAIRHVLVENAQNYSRIPAVRRVLQPMFGRGLFLSDGDEWRRQRRAISPAFAPRAVHMLAPRVVAAADELATELDGTFDQPLNLMPRLQQLALEVIGRTIFSLDMPCYGRELRSLILDYAVRLARASLADFLLPPAIPTLADIARARFRRRWLRLITRIVDERASRWHGGEPRDLFDILAAPDCETGLSPDPDTLGDQIATLVVAGQETTSAALTWGLYLLAQHPEAQKRVAAEVAAVRLTPANAPDVLQRLKYARAVIDEVLRLYPPAFVIVRRALSDDAAAGIAVPKGSLVLISPWVLHRHHHFWSAPQRFDPTRFLQGASPPRFAYLPFGVGPRVCVGASFALTELVLVIATLVRAFEIRLATHDRVNPVGHVTLQPTPPPLFLLTPRSEGVPARERKSRAGAYGAVAA